ncbi:MAG: class I SAM-dependent methyltransferase [Oligoflexia bacterium]|nr:class I SAM-dependent methyltransferase [Oligoflexia bacterium]
MPLTSYMVSCLKKQRTFAYEKNIYNIYSLLEKSSPQNILDIGCDDGALTLAVGERAGVKNLYGIECIPHRAAIARERGIEIKEVTLKSGIKMPYEDNFFDLVLSNQVIEHVGDVDHFMEEIYRVLAPNGHAIISTENLSSWHNIAALVLGYMPFSLTNITNKTAALGNPLDFNHGKSFCWEGTSWQHIRVFTLKGLQHLFSLHGFKVESVKASGYYPLGNWVSRFDRAHSAFITFKIKKECLEC